MTNKLYLGVDPGRSKTGLALVDQQGTILQQRIVATADFPVELARFVEGHSPILIVLGNGTNSDNIKQGLQQVLPRLPVQVINEAHSTEEARELYWQCRPPQGWRRLLPLGLQVPPVPLDDYAAVILVRRYLEGQQ